MTNLNHHTRLLAATLVASLLGAVGCRMCFVPTENPPPTLRYALSADDIARPDATCAADPFAALIIIATIVLEGGDGYEPPLSVGQTTAPPPGVVRIEFGSVDEPASVQFISSQIVGVDGVVESLGLDPAVRYLNGAGAAQTAARRAFFVNSQQNTLGVFDTATGQSLRQIRVGSDPRGVAASLDGSRLYVGNHNSGSITPIDVATLATFDSISLNGAGLPEDVAISRDGKTLYVVNGADSGSLFFIDTESEEVTGNLRTGRQPTKLALSPDGSTAYVANTGGGNVAVIDTLSQTVVGSLNVSNATDVVVSANGETVYVAAGAAAGRVLAFDAASFLETEDWSVGQTPGGVALSPDGNLLFVTNTESEELHVIDLVIGEIVAEIEVPRGLGPLVVLPRS